MEPNVGHSQQNFVFSKQLLHVYPLDKAVSDFSNYSFSNSELQMQHKINSPYPPSTKKKNPTQQNNNKPPHHNNKNPTNHQTNPKPIKKNKTTKKNHKQKTPHKTKSQLNKNHTPHTI